MFSLLEDEAAISRAQRKLTATLRREFSQRAVRNIGYPGGTKLHAKVSTDGAYWFWTEEYFDPDVAHPRILNWFGRFGERALHISVEVNVPRGGIDAAVAGFFATHPDSGAVYLFHSGRIGGGRPGVGKAAFLAWTDQKLAQVTDSKGNIHEGVLVMPVEGRGAATSAKRYIDAIAEFKRAARAGDTDAPELEEKKRSLDEFFKEARGRRKGTRASEIDYLSRHGDVVDALFQWRSASALPKRARIVKSALIDLGVAAGDQLIEVYEVKTSTARSDIYSAIGQLMVHGATETCQRRIVLPRKDKLQTDLQAALSRLSVEIIWFELDESRATILSR